jgi:hypothetical protein
VDLRQRDVLGQPRRMLVDAGNIGFALDAHRQASSPFECCAASWAINASWKSDNFRPEKPC